MKRLWDSDEPYVRSDVIKSTYMDYLIKSMKEDLGIWCLFGILLCLKFEDLT
jgi:hypothetical protein